MTNRAAALLPLVVPPGRGPCCGGGSAFAGILARRAGCAARGRDARAPDGGDGPAVAVIGARIVHALSHPPLSVPALVWPLPVLLLAACVMRVAKPARAARRACGVV